MKIVATAGIVGVIAGMSAILLARRGWALVALSLFAVAIFDPVLAVGCLFFIAHALPLQKRQIRRYGIKNVLRSAGWFTLVAAIGGIVGCWAVVQGLLELPLAVAIALGMATPHMLTEQLEH